MFLSVVILGRFTTETHAMALYISTDTPPLFTPRPGTFPCDVHVDGQLLRFWVGDQLVKTAARRTPGAVRIKQAMRTSAGA